MITEWRQREFMAQISGRVVNGMDTACKFAADQAKAKAPSKRVKWSIEHEVKARGLTVEGRVGSTMTGGLAIWFELGTSSRTRKSGGGTGTMPAKPWLRPAVFGNAKEIVRLVTGG